MIFGARKRDCYELKDCTIYDFAQITHVIAYFGKKPEFFSDKKNVEIYRIGEHSLYIDNFIIVIVFNKEMNIHLISIDYLDSNEN